MNQEATTDAQQRHGGSDQKKKKKISWIPFLFHGLNQILGASAKKKKMQDPRRSTKTTEKKNLKKSEKKNSGLIRLFGRCRCVDGGGIWRSEWLVTTLRRNGVLPWSYSVV